MGPRDAYPGDEDQGQMSSWYILSSIGLFSKWMAVAAKILYGYWGVRDLTGRNSVRQHLLLWKKTYHKKQKMYPKTIVTSQYVRFNNKRLSNNYIEWSKLKKERTLHFIMGDRPNPNAFK